MAAIPVQEPRPPEHWRFRVFPPQAWAPTASSTPIHEAGHVVAAMSMEMPVYDAACVASGAGRAGVLASVRSIPMETPPPPAEVVRDTLLDAFDLIWPGMPKSDAAIRYTVMLTAGRQAELIASGVPLVGELLMHDPDHLQARSLLAATGQRLAMGFVQRLARYLLAERWAEVETIAAALRQTGYWSANSVKRYSREACLGGNAKPPLQLGCDLETH